MTRNRIAALFVVMVIAIGSLTAHAEAANSLPTVQQIAQIRRDEILGCVSRRQYREAIIKAAQYERELVSRYQPPTYEMGLLQSEAEHVAFHSPFDTWKRVDVEEMELPNKEMLEMGYTILLGLEGDSEEELLLVFCINVKQLEQRTGTPEVGQMFRSDQGLQLFGQMLAGNFGMVRSQHFKVVGDHRILLMEINLPMVGPELRMALLPHDGRIFVSLLASPTGDIVTNEKRLLDMVKTMSFAYKPEDKVAITAKRAESDRQDMESLLECVEDLAELGEYGAAAEDLAELRLLVHSRMPRTEIRGNTAYCPAYGVTLKNPDASRWKLSVEKEGTLEGIFLEDKYSVSQGGIMVGVTDFVLAYGPTAMQMMEDEEIGKQMLIGAGRGSAMSMGQIENESFTTIKGNFAYEATVTPFIPGVKARVQWIMGSGYGLMILVLGDARSFQEKVAECDQIIGDSLELEPFQRLDDIDYTVKARR